MESMRRFQLVAGLSVAFLIIAVTALVRHSDDNDGSRVVGRVEDANGNGTLRMLSEPYELDKTYESMQGPRSNHAGLQLSQKAKANDTVWVTGIDTQIVDAVSLDSISNEFFCHSNLTLSPGSSSPKIHNASFSDRTHMDWRFFTLVPGRMQINLPEGFGIPIKNRTQLDYFTMSLNLTESKSRRIRMQTKIRYQRKQRQLRPLFRRALYVYQQFSEDIDQLKIIDKVCHEGELCASSKDTDQKSDTPSTFSKVAGSKPQHPGATCCVASASDDGVLGQFGKTNTIHWMVPPGRHQYQSEVTEQFELPFDTTAHYITGHLHPFALSLSLVDAKTGKTVFHITSRDYKDRRGVASMSEIVSTKGISLAKGQRFILKAEYNNTSDKPIDAMAILYVYLLDQPAAKAEMATRLTASNR